MFRKICILSNVWLNIVMVVDTLKKHFYTQTERQTTRENRLWTTHVL